MSGLAIFAMFTRCTCQQKLIETKHLLVATNFQVSMTASFFLPKLRSIRPLSNLAIAQFSRSINHQPLYMIKEKAEKEVW